MSNGDEMSAEVERAIAMLQAGLVTERRFGYDEEVEDE